MLRDTRFQRFEVYSLTGALGAEVRGVDLGSLPDEAVFEELRRALFEHHVLAVRDQNLNPQSLHTVARRFGPHSGNPIHQPMEGSEDIIKFVREPDDTGKVIGEDWHMDLAWLAKPPGMTMLYGEEVPPVGGDTCFASLERAYAALSPGMKAMLEPLTAVHSGRGVYAINAVHKRLGTRSNAQASDDVEVEHPVICRHPATGRPYVFASSVLARFKGWTEAETKPIVDYLVWLATKPEHTCRVRWEQRTLTMWDNPVLLHTAINDYPGYRRVCYRTTIEGWVPQALAPKAVESRAA